MKHETDEKWKRVEAKPWNYSRESLGEEAMYYYCYYYYYEIKMFTINCNALEVFNGMLI